MQRLRGRRYLHARQGKKQVQRLRGWSKIKCMCSLYMMRGRMQLSAKVEGTLEMQWCICSQLHLGKRFAFS
jgi:hypothetical protein